MAIEILFTTVILPNLCLSNVLIKRLVGTPLQYFMFAVPKAEWCEQEIIG